MKRLFILILIIVLFLGCSEQEKINKGGRSSVVSNGDLTIITDIESNELFQIIEKFAQNHNISFEIDKETPQDIVQELKNPRTKFNAIFLSNPLWLHLVPRNEQRFIHRKIIMHSPVAIGIKQAKARELDWLEKEIGYEDILAAIERGDLKFIMSNATQANSSFLVYFTLLSAFAQEPETLTYEHLTSYTVQDKTARFLAGVNRSADSDNWLKQIFIRNYDSLDAMINTEVMLIDTNKELINNNQEPLHVIYPQDGLVTAESLLAYIDNGEEKDEQLYLELSEYLTSEIVAKELSNQGYRTEYIATKFNSAWGIKIEYNFPAFKWPEAQVITEALNLYQTKLRKPSLTIFALNYSASLAENGIGDLKQAMTGMMDPKIGSLYFEQPSVNDIIVIIPFNNGLMWEAPRAALCNNATALNLLLQYVLWLEAEGGADIYYAAQKALDVFNQYASVLHNYKPALILMTDSVSDETVNNINTLKEYWQNLNAPFALPPIYCIGFGNADYNQLQDLADFSGGKVFRGHDDLVKAFRQAKSNN